jgi:outer membrane protein TolC
MTRLAALIVCALGAATAGAAAQEPLTLETAVQTALLGNASLRAARAARDEAGAQTRAARSDFFPRVTFTESWQRGDQPVFVFSSLLSARRFAVGNFAIDALNHPDPVGFFRAAVGLEQLVFDGGQRAAVADAAALRRDIAGLSADEAAAGLALAATQTFGRVIAAQAARRAAAAGVDAAREDLSRAERRRDTGMLSDADVLGLAAHLADLQQRAIAAESDAAIARAELNRQMGVPIEREYDYLEPAVVVGAAPQPPLPTLFAEADAARPETRRADAARRLADTGRRQARSTRLPQLAVQAGVDVSGTRINDRASSWIAGGELRWALSLGGAQRAREQVASAATVRAAAEADDARSVVHVEVISALRRLQSAAARASVGRAAADQARESQRIVRERFDAGLAGVNDVLRASAAVLDADAQRASAVVDAITGEAMLRQALGRTP